MGWTYSTHTQGTHHPNHSWVLMKMHVKQPEGMTRWQETVWLATSSEVQLASTSENTMSRPDSSDSRFCEGSSSNECESCFPATLCFTVMADLCCLVWTSARQHLVQCFSIYKVQGMFPTIPKRCRHFCCSMTYLTQPNSSHISCLNLYFLTIKKVLFFCFYWNLVADN